MGRGGKCAIFSFGQPLQIQHRPGDLPKAHLRDVAGGRAEGVQGLRGIEIQNPAKIIVNEILARITAAACQQHKGHAFLQGGSERHFHIQIVQFLQKAVLGAASQLGQIVRHIVLHGVFCGGDKRRRKARFILQLSEAVFQRLRDIRCIFLPYRPDGNGTGKPRSMGVGNVKIVLEP